MQGLHGASKNIARSNFIYYGSCKPSSTFLEKAHESIQYIIQYSLNIINNYSLSCDYLKKYCFVLRLAAPRRPSDC